MRKFIFDYLQDHCSHEIAANRKATSLGSNLELITGGALVSTFQLQEPVRIPIGENSPVLLAVRVVVRLWGPLLLRKEQFGAVFILSCYKPQINLPVDFLET